jgi:hypothetical protein
MTSKLIPLRLNELIINRGGPSGRYNQPLSHPFATKEATSMSFYCGIDLSARVSHVCVINRQLSRLVDQKVLGFIN